MPRVTPPIEADEYGRELDVPTDAGLRALRNQVDGAEVILAERRAAIADAIRAAVEGGVSMAHVARTVGWSRQWCYHVLDRWSANGGGG